MKILDDVVVNAKSVASEIGKKAGKAFDLSKLKFSAADLSGEINKKYKSLGKLVFLAKREGAQNDLEIENVMNEIEQLQDDLDAVNEEILLIRNKKVCPVCKKENPVDALFCNACGTPLSVPEEKKEEAEEAVSEAAEAAEEVCEKVEDAAQDAVEAVKDAADEILGE